MSEHMLPNGLEIARHLQKYLHLFKKKEGDQGFGPRIFPGFTVMGCLKSAPNGRHHPLREVLRPQGRPLSHCSGHESY